MIFSCSCICLCGKGFCAHGPSLWFLYGTFLFLCMCYVHDQNTHTHTHTPTHTHTQSERERESCLSMTNLFTSVSTIFPSLSLSICLSLLVFFLSFPPFLSLFLPSTFYSSPSSSMTLRMGVQVLASYLSILTD